MPITYGVMTYKEHPDPDVLLLEWMRGVLVEIPARTPERQEQLKDQIVEVLLAWHCQDSRGCVSAADNTQRNLWPSWYRQHVEVLWTMLNQFNNIGLTMQDRRILSRIRERFSILFEGLNDDCVLIRDNFCLCDMPKGLRSDRLLAMIGPGLVLWVPREHELSRLMDNSLARDLFWSYL